MNIEINIKKSKKIPVTVLRKDIISNVVFNDDFNLTDSFDPYKGVPMSRVNYETLKICGVMTIKELIKLENNEIGAKIFDLCKWYEIQEFNVEKKNDKYAQVLIKAIHKFKK